MSGQQEEDEKIVDMEMYQLELVQLCERNMEYIFLNLIVLLKCPTLTQQKKPK